MAAIDQYKHRLLGFINCPSHYEIVSGNSSRDIAVYELLERIPAGENDFDGNAGDILVGGGSGEAPAFRITIPTTVDFFLNDNVYNLNSYDDLFKAFWTPTESFILCDGFRKLGWDPKQSIEFWLAENVCIALVNEVEQFKHLTEKHGLVSKLTWKTNDD